ncbi:hypothetical protein FOXG_07209 [Fusarium oxysporum f. sp. lycopersici 4287]|uniref:Uncharacterized protein n=2 Tax=Fusarium oxysporum TaxID=5507 RepID=A0A0J9UZP9_FUSO4|nr:hypothetical protein FOXG_06617 [Fusarium oxysporum f. sp. lycopersici 4287]XP_018242630.1 hypothetical protein FOXG_06641 [Fusarium oxysporum f. sp. lycopersici 4287]XP_018244563.1 hypothetical protein FOXG_07209 [Fusarium oxysporum f. sp. lycopersici 4287]KAJ9419387.1 hypothetical protein QL093DRAFT_2565480 [Fusarium oxysporum]KNB04552.1 hypothetical protein FOXG_06617 [Fusarium oxysporum f. sp. lycopersici 4287]KNB04585.1 hypothetical protein FOXG_06641 [Fusarium oxysporum f. sp. lycoper
MKSTPSINKVYPLRNSSLLPVKKDSSRTTGLRDDIIVTKLQELIRGNRLHCTLCFIQRSKDDGPGSKDADTHMIENCYYQDHKSEAHVWLKVLEDYKAQSHGPGARCNNCRFPKLLCWQTLHREMLDAKYGNEDEAREQTGESYPVVSCEWVKPVKDFVAACMVADGKTDRTGVTLLGATALRYMGWKNWDDLEKIGPQCILLWLQEMDEIQGLRCPRLLKLYWLLASVRHDDMDRDLDLGMELDGDYETESEGDYGTESEDDCEMESEGD